MLWAQTNLCTKVLLDFFDFLEKYGKIACTSKIYFQQQKVIFWVQNSFHALDLQCCLLKLGAFDQFTHAMENDSASKNRKEDIVCGSPCPVAHLTLPSPILEFPGILGR